ncbi:DNA polymerase III subunit beta [Thiohalobacter sp. IOR34]|uniref:DNA polymerase III subunit beta n=1 Tax=Thiohalobacter sp. IOR34 TaxID=3057176 RepID=UPI0025B17231|nr:DNA polymerase III subunit beta [Thiohalobacter sp. IOR34]WJW75509.1 DNA polymerase III subunit beta [Thiohalobacter sp. IOR34]
MKFTIQREALLKPLQQITGVVERRQTLPVLGNVLVQADESGLTLTATDLEVELVARVEMPIEDGGEITLPARKLLDICRSLPEGSELEIEVGDERAKVRSGRSRFTLTSLPASDFPVIEELNSAQSFSLPQKDLKEIIERTHFAMAQSDVRYYLNGLMLELQPEQIRAVATDGHRLALSEMPAQTGVDDTQQVIVPRKGVQELLRLLENSEGEVNIQLGSNHIRVSTPEIRFTSKLIDGRFPDYQRVIPKGGDKLVTADVGTLRQALSRTSILSNEKYRGIRLSLEPDALRIQAHNPEQEEAEEEVEINYSADPMEIGFNVTYLLDALAAIPGKEVRILLSDSNSSCLIDDPASGQSRYVVMPMRL